MKCLQVISYYSSELSGCCTNDHMMATDPTFQESNQGKVTTSQVIRSLKTLRRTAAIASLDLTFDHDPQRHAQLLIL